MELLGKSHSRSRNPNMQSSQGSSTGLAAIALGSNLSSHLGSSVQMMESAIRHLAHHSDLALVGVSQWYQTVAIGPPQPDYINGCALVQVSHDSSVRTPQALLDLLLEVEQKFGRTRAQRWGPRTLDLDLLLYDSVVVKTATLTLPHPRMTERAFVLVPLAEILPDWVDPQTGLTIRELCDRVDCTGVSPLSTRETQP
jgi:2-amino-4-hydroxy-6-hydroxymethyldihydropteridine diphosphokinase